MEITAEFKLPLTLGSQTLSNPASFTLNSQQNQLRLLITKPHLAQLYMYNQIGAVIKYQQSTVILSSKCDKKQQLKMIPVRANLSEHVQPAKIFPFMLRMLSSGQQLTLHSSKQRVFFQLRHVSKAKFISNEYLAQVTNRQEEWGLLSMDNSQRILIQMIQTTFPVIGVWTKQNTSDLRCMDLYYNFLQRSASKKCLFLKGNKSYFYAVKINPEKGHPELYLVSWQFRQPHQQTLWPCVKQNQLVFQTSDQSSFEFTLRSDEKVPSKLMNIECSPIKPTTFAEHLWLSNSQPDSPKFSTNTQNVETNALKKLVRQQEIQINQLKAEVLMLRRKLRAKEIQGRQMRRQESVDIQGKNRYLRVADLSSMRTCGGSSGASSSGQEDLNEIWERYELRDFK